MCCYSQHVFDYDAHKFHISIDVLPAYRQRWTGTSQYDTVHAELQSYEATVLRADAYSNLPELRERRLSGGVLEFFTMQ